MMKICRDDETFSRKCDGWLEHRGPWEDSVIIMNVVEAFRFAGHAAVSYELWIREPRW